jgi:aspartate kinase
MKFGGTSVQDSNAVKNVIEIVSSEKASKVVVLSAISKATNSLELIAELSSAGSSDAAFSVLDDLVKRHFVMINDLLKKEKLKKEADGQITKFYNEIKELIKGLSIIRELTLRTLDAFRVYGELMSTTVIYYAMLENGLNAELIDSRKIIKTNNDFSRAYPDFELTKKNIDEIVIPLLNKNKIVIAQGFISSTEDGISTTMGRESSDFSGVIYGTLIESDEIQIWTDVDGVLSADPNIIKNACRLSEISYREMEELSNFGAKVLHKNSVKPAMKSNIPIRILNSKNRNSIGTIVNNELKYHWLLKSITYKKNIKVLRLCPKEDPNQYVFWELMLNILNRHKPQIDILQSSNNAIILVIAENNYTKIHWEDLKNEFEEISDFELIKDKVLITLVGSDIYKINSLEQRIFISNPGIKTESIASGYNRHSFSFLVNEVDHESVLRNLHHEFFELIESGDGLFEKPERKEDLIA